jgi:predicted HTH domain antitoxin
MSKKSVSVRANKEILEKIELLSNKKNLSKSEIFRKALDLGLNKILEDLSVELFSKGELSFSEGAKLCGMYIGEYMELLARRGVRQDPYNLEIYNHIIKNRKKILSEIKKENKYNS